MTPDTFQLVLDSLPFLLKGAIWTIVLSLGGMFFGMLLGFGLALVRLYAIAPLGWLARVYISFFRGTPLLYSCSSSTSACPSWGCNSSL